MPRQLDSDRPGVVLHLRRRAHRARAAQRVLGGWLMPSSRSRLRERGVAHRARLPPRPAFHARARPSPGIADKAGAATPHPAGACRRADCEGGGAPCCWMMSLHRVAAQPQQPGDLPHRLAFLVEQEHGLTLVRFDHGVALRCQRTPASGSGCRRSTNETARERPGCSVCRAPGFCPSPAAYTSASVPNPPAAPAQTRCTRRGFGALAAFVPAAGPGCL